MVEYTLELKISNNADRVGNSCNYVLNLSSQEEDYPEQKFTDDFCQEIRSVLQKKSSCKIDQTNLKKIVKLWLEDIKEGYRETTVNIDLPTFLGEDLESINESGNQQIPPLFTPSLSTIEPQIGELPKLNFS